MIRRGVFPAVVFAIIAVALLVIRRAPASVERHRSQEDTRPWSLQTASTGMTFTWNRAAQELRGASSMELVIQDGDRSNTHRLDRPSGTLVIPFQPQFAKLRIDGREIPVFGSEPSHPEPTVVTP